jgi:hypothetical protein
MIQKLPNATAIIKGNFPLYVQTHSAVEMVGILFL